MNNRELKLFHYENKIHITKEMLEGTEIFVDGAVNASMDLRIYGASCQGVPSDDSFFTFAVDDETMTASVKAASTEISGDIVIPYKYVVDNKVYSVTSIGSGAFKKCTNIISVTLPNSVTSIGSGAFEKCTNLISVIIPNSVTSIEFKAFAWCESLESITIPDGVTTIESEVFNNCQRLISIIIPNSVTSIGSYAFLSCLELTNITVSNSVTSIGEGAFFNCAFASITIPKSVTSIGKNAFGSCLHLDDIYYGGTKEQWDEIIIAEGNDYLLNATIHYGFELNSDKYYGNVNIFPSDDSFFTFTVDDETMTASIKAASTEISGDLVIPYKYAVNGKIYSVTSIGMRAFAFCENLISVIIPNSVTKIGILAFNGCANLIKITISDSVTIIEQEAFNDCASLTNINIPDSVTYIGGCVFRGCKSLTNINIPNGVTDIDWDTFCYCESLTNINIPNTVRIIGEGAFYKCHKLSNVYYEGAKEQWDEIIIAEGNDYLLNATIHYGFELDSDKYYGNVNIIPSDVSFFTFTVDDETMTASVKAASTEISGDLVIPYKYAVNGKIYSVTSIGRLAFDDCTGLTSVTIPNSIISIELGAFWSCTGITEINIPNSVTSIGENAFYLCSKLKSITLPDTITKIEDSMLASCRDLVNIDIPESVTSIGKRAFSSCDSLHNVIIPNGVTSIGEQAFWACFRFSFVNIVNIPSSVTSIGEGAFEKCSHLSDVYYEGTKEQWGNIEIGENNEALLNAKIYYESESPSENYPSNIYSSRKMSLESSDGTITNSTKIPFVGNAMEVSDFAKSNLTVDGKYYIADYIEYNSLTDKAYRHKFIDDTLFDNTLPLKDQIQVILENPIVEELTAESDKYIFKNVKSIQDGCVISVKGYGADRFPSPPPLKIIANIKVIRLMTGTYKVKNLVEGLTMEFVPFLLNGIKFDEYAMTISGKEYVRAKVGEPIKIAAELLNANSTRIVFYSSGEMILCLVPRPSIFPYGVLLEE